jgi:hypothetical protein
MLQINHILLLLILLAFPHGLPDHRFMLQFFLPAHPQDHEPSISSTISLPICEPIFSSPTSYRNSPMGPPPFISFPEVSCPHWGTHFTLGHPFLYLYIFPQFIHYLLYKCLYSQSLHLSSPLATRFPFGHMKPMSPLVGALLLIFPRRHHLCFQSTTQVTYLYPLNLFTLSSLWHSLSLILSSP